MINSELQIITRDGVDVVDSREVARLVGKQHAHLMRDIKGYAEVLESSTESNFGLSDFFIPHTYTDSTGRTLPCYLITKKGCDMVANKMTGEKGVLFTAAYVTAFEKMREAVTSARPLSPAEQLLAQAQLMVEQEKRLSAVETRQTELAERCGENGRKLDTLTAVIVEPYASEQDWQERIGRTIRAAVAQYGLNYRRFYAELYDELERTAGVSLKSRQTRLKKRMLAAGSTKSQCGAVTKLYVISMDKKLRPLMESILRRRILEYAAAKPAAVR